MNSKAPTPHGRGVRGLTLPRSSLLFEGNFGRLFRALPPAEFGDNDKESEDSLKALAETMVGGEDQPKTVPTQKKVAFQPSTLIWANSSTTI
jgi:hypothetical protein